MFASLCLLFKKLLDRVKKNANQTCQKGSPEITLNLARVLKLNYLDIIPGKSGALPAGYCKFSAIVSDWELASNSTTAKENINEVLQMFSDSYVAMDSKAPHQRQSLV